MILDEQGYIVLGNDGQEPQPGLQFQFTSPFIFGVPASDLGRLMIVDVAQAEDLEKQCARYYPVEVGPHGPAAFRHYHKVAAE